MWAAANTLTIYAIRNVGLSIAFPLWNANSLLGIFWGFLLFNELHYAGWKRWLGFWVARRPCSRAQLYWRVLLPANLHRVKACWA